MFADRADAGRQLGQRLQHLRGPEVVVLGLPRGGVEVAAEVAAALAAPLDVIMVRKLGVPSQPELAMALSLVEMLQEPFDPQQYSDNYRTALLDMIEAKRNGQEIVAPPEAPLPQTVDLMAALKASLEAAKKGKGGAEPTPIATKDAGPASRGKDEPEETEELAVAF